MQLNLSRGRGFAATPVSTWAFRWAFRRNALRRRPLRGEGGQAVVEFALVLPLVAAVVLVLLQFGRVIYSYIGLTHLSNEGARYAAVNLFPGGATSVSGYICPKFGTNPTSLNKKVTVAFTAATPGSPTAGDAVNVTVSENYKLIPYWGAASIPISSTTSMRLEQKPTYSSEATSC